MEIYVSEKQLGSLWIKQSVLTLCVFISIFYSVSLVAHPTDTTALIQKIESSRSVDDKVKLLTQLCDTLLAHKSYDRLIHFAQRCATYAENINDTKSAVEALYYETRGHFSHKNIDAYLLSAQQGIQKANQIDANNRKAYFLNIMGIGSRKKGNLEEAIEYYEQAVEINLLIKDSSYLAKNYSNIGLCYQASGDYTNAIKYQGKALEIRQNLRDSISMAKSHFALGNDFQSLGNNEKALNNYLAALDIYQALNKSNWIANSLFSVGLVYHTIENFDSALDYYNQAKEVAEREHMDDLSAAIYMNIGNIHADQEDFSLSIKSQKKALSIYKALEEEVLVGSTLLNIGLIFLEEQKLDSAQNYLIKSYEILDNQPSEYDLTNVIIELGHLFTLKGNYPRALSFLNQGLQKSKEADFAELESYAHLYLYQLHDKMGQSDMALAYYKDHVKIKDSINVLEQEEEITRILAPFDFDRQEAEIELLNKDNLLKEAEVQKAANQKNLSYILLAFMTLIGIGSFYQYRFAQRKNKIILLEKERSEVLLLNILPDETAEELKKFGSVKAKNFEKVTVMFTDFVDFTQYAESVKPVDLVKSVDYYFSAFDKIIEDHGIEKIKTIGDAYMCVGGLPKPDSDNAYKVVLAAQEIMKVIEDTKSDPPEGVHPFDIRIGINTGPVVAGVVGTHKFQYDIWGDTVNIAARMESNCVPGQINISESTYNEVKDKFNCEYIGDAVLKRRGVLKMYGVISHASISVS